MQEPHYNCFNPKPLPKEKITDGAATQTFEETRRTPALVTSPFTLDFSLGCCVGRGRGEFLTVTLTLKTMLPITRRMVNPARGMPRQWIDGKPIKCSNQEKCSFFMNKREGCFLTAKRDFGCHPENLLGAIFHKITVDVLQQLIKENGCEIVARKGFLPSAYACGLSWAEIWRTVDPYLPEGKLRRQFWERRKKRSSEIHVSGQVLARFIKANGYEIVNTKGISAAAQVSGLARPTVTRILAQYPPKEPYVRTNWARRKTGEHGNKRRLAAPIKPETLEKFIKLNGYEIGKKQGILEAASACGLHRCTVSKIMRYVESHKSFIQTTPPFEYGKTENRHSNLLAKNREG